MTVHAGPSWGRGGAGQRDRPNTILHTILHIIGYADFHIAGCCDSNRTRHFHITDGG